MGKGQHSTYDFYYKSSYPLLSVQRLGLLTSMRIDLQRVMTNWSPELDELPPVVDRELADYSDINQNNNNDT